MFEDELRWSGLVTLVMGFAARIIIIPRRNPSFLVFFQCIDSARFLNREGCDLKRWKTGRFPTAPRMDSGVLIHNPLDGGDTEGLPSNKQVAVIMPD